MNRRNLLVILTVVPFLGFRSCAERQNTLALLTETLGNAVASLVQIAGNPAMAARLKEHTATAVSLLRAWKPGMSAVDIIRALNQIIDDLTMFPGLEKYKPLITFVLGTIASIIEQLKQAGGGGEDPHTKVRITLAPKTSDEFKHDWDAIRAGSENMHDAPIL